MLKATWRISNLFNADAQTVSEEILGIGDNVKPNEIVKYAREHMDSELHKCFTWDDSAAANKWRIHEARNIVGNLVIVKEQDGESEPMYIRIFHKTAETNYQSISLYVKDMDKYQMLLDEAMRELRAFKKKYANLSELQEILDLID